MKGVFSAPFEGIFLKALHWDFCVIPPLPAAIDTGRKADADKDKAARQRQHQGYSNRTSHSYSQHVLFYFVLMLDAPCKHKSLTFFVRAFRNDKGNEKKQIAFLPWTPYLLLPPLNHKIFYNPNHINASIRAFAPSNRFLAVYFHTVLSSTLISNPAENIVD
ncbi:hypothetical protein SUGI_1069920 [Cryptomeria japonica]|nr:hypothetical protein SUGI_1069920 [Cryptomeria japonica]